MERLTHHLVIKTYFANQRHPGGAVSNILDWMPIGEEIGDCKFIIEAERRVSLKHHSLSVG
jgi:hypothetical protein